MIEVVEEVEQPQIVDVKQDPIPSYDRVYEDSFQLPQLRDSTPLKSE